MSNDILNKLENVKATISNLEQVLRDSEKELRSSIKGKILAGDYWQLRNGGYIEIVPSYNSGIHGLSVTSKDHYLFNSDGSCSRFPDKKYGDSCEEFDLMKKVKITIEEIN